MADCYIDARFPNIFGILHLPGTDLVADPALISMSDIEAAEEALFGRFVEATAFLQPMLKIIAVISAVVAVIEAIEDAVTTLDFTAFNTALALLTTAVAELLAEYAPTVWVIQLYIDFKRVLRAYLVRRVNWLNGLRNRVNDINAARADAYIIATPALDSEYAAYLVCATDALWNFAATISNSNSPVGTALVIMNFFSSLVGGTTIPGAPDMLSIFNSGTDLSTTIGDMIIALNGFIAILDALP